MRTIDFKEQIRGTAGAEQFGDRVRDMGRRLRRTVRRDSEVIHPRI